MKLRVFTAREIAEHSCTDPVKKGWTNSYDMPYTLYDAITLFEEQTISHLQLQWVMEQVAFPDYGDYLAFYRGVNRRVGIVAEATPEFGMLGGWDITTVLAHLYSVAINWEERERILAQIMRDVLSWERLHDLQDV